MNVPVCGRFPRAASGTFMEQVVDVPFPYMVKIPRFLRNM